MSGNSGFLWNMNFFKQSHEKKSRHPSRGLCYEKKKNKRRAPYKGALRFE